jgi:NADH-quinone oxidoreductase subunit K
MNVPIYNYLVVGAVLFALGTVGFIARRNLIIMFLSAEMMLQGVSLNLVAFSRLHGNMSGQTFTLFILTVAACESALAMALILMVYRSKKSLDALVWQDLREPNLEPTEDLDAIEIPTPEKALPHLTTAGIEPARREEETSNV